MSNSRIAPCHDAPRCRSTTSSRRTRRLGAPLHFRHLRELASRAGLLVALVFLLAAPLLAAAGPADRYETSLNGTWDFLPHDGTVAGTPGSITVPSFWDTDAAWSDVTHATFSRAFDVPATWVHHRVVLRFGAVSFRARVTLNGTLLGTHDGDGTPFEFDVTDLVTATGNQLDVEVFDQEVVSPGAYYTYPIGLPVRPGSIPAYLGICQAVTLVGLPLVHTSDVHIVPRVSNGEIEVHVTVRNDDQVAHSVTVEGEILDAGTSVKSLPAPAATTIAAGGIHVFSSVEPWANPILWWPGQPHLYELRTRILEAGIVLDTADDTRFGYREITIDGRDYRLNGLRFNMRGETTVYPKFLFDDRPTIEAQMQRWKNIGINVVRYHTQPPPPLFLDIADEMGLPIIDESVVYCSDEDLDLGNPFFWQNSRDHIAEWVPRDRNHPSVVTWSVANECLYKNTPPVSTTDLFTLETELLLYDDSRPVIYDGDGAIGGLALTSNKHYPSNIAHLESADAAHAYTNWYSLDPYWMDGVVLTRPTGIGEWMYNKAPSSNPNNVYYSRNWGRVKALMIRGYRANNFADIRPFTVGQEGLKSSSRYTYPIFASSFAANAVFDVEHDDLWADLFAPGSPLPALDEGTFSARNLIVFNEDLSDLPDDQILVEWRTEILNQTIDSGSFTAAVTPGEHIQQTISMPVPTVAGSTPFFLVLNARKGGGLVFEDRRAFLAQETGVAANEVPTILVDTFDAHSPNDVWTFFDTEWARTGVLQATGLTSQKSVAALDHYLFDDFTLEFDVRLTSGSGWAGMSFRRVRPEDYHHESGYTVFLTAGGGVRLYDSNSNSVVDSAATGAGNTMRRVRIEATGARIQVWVDGVAYLDHTDPSTPITAAGYVGFMKSAGATAEYDNVRISAALLSPCGDGVIEGAEECDDGNMADGDCCSAVCTAELLGSPCSDDANECTDDICSAIGTCEHLPNTQRCDDGELCTTGDVCNAGVCVPGACRTGEQCSVCGGECSGSDGTCGCIF
ncbi:MAG: glycoside hydrolase family 2 TIM barrel-domain containing protein [Deltaproteobacteria bacterium]